MCFTGYPTLFIHQSNLSGQIEKKSDVCILVDNEISQFQILFILENVTIRGCKWDSGLLPQEFVKEFLS